MLQAGAIAFGHLQLVLPKAVISSRERCWVCCATASDEAQAQRKRTKLPERGFFAEADTKAPVYSPLSAVSGGGSIYERKGRYNPEFLWNTNWKDQVDLEEAVDRARTTAHGKEKEVKGGLGLSALTELNNMEADLTERLLKKASPSEAVSRGQAGSEGLAGPEGPAPWQGRQAAMQQAAEMKVHRGAYPQMPPRRGEAQRWERNSKFAQRAAPQEPTTPEEAATQAAAVEAERVAYGSYKTQLMQITLLLSGGLLALTYAGYGQEVALSYGIGAIGSIAYLTMLNRSIDGVGGVGAAAAQPRLLIPLILAMGYNRWNTLASGTMGIELQLMPMLLGFLTYKAAVISRGGADLFAEISGRDIATNSGANSITAASETSLGSRDSSDARLQAKA